MEKNWDRITNYNNIISTFFEIYRMHLLDLQSNNAEHFFKIDSFFLHKRFLCVSPIFTSVGILSFFHPPFQVNT